MTVHPHPSRSLPCRPPRVCVAEAEAALSQARLLIRWGPDWELDARDQLVLAGAAIAEALVGLEPESSGAAVAAEADE